MPRGGRRPGAGRPKQYIKLTAEEAYKLNQIVFFHQTIENNETCTPETLLQLLIEKEWNRIEERMIQAAELAKAAQG